MSVGAKLAAFAAILAASFGVGAFAGAAIGPIDVDGDTPTEHSPSHGSDVLTTTPTTTPTTTTTTTTTVVTGHGTHTES